MQTALIQHLEVLLAQRLTEEALGVIGTMSSNLLE